VTANTRLSSPRETTSTPGSGDVVTWWQAILVGCVVDVIVLVAVLVD
jgi:hypothetical protein